MCGCPGYTYFIVPLVFIARNRYSFCLDARKKKIYTVGVKTTALATTCNFIFHYTST